MESDLPDDAMVTIAALISRVEALVLASMLEAGGILVHVDGAAHASVSVNSLALGGHRLWVPALQHEAASTLLIEVLGKERWAFSYGLQRAILRLVGAWAALWSAIAIMWWGLGQAPLALVLLGPLNAVTIPVNPQGRGDYYLHPKARHPAA